MAIPNDVEILDPWSLIECGPNHTPGFHVAELQKELCPGHVLHGVRATAVAHRVDCDDVLFEVEGVQMPLAVVHLTWQKESTPEWPATQFFESWEQWVHDEMLPAHEDRLL